MTEKIMSQNILRKSLILCVCCLCALILAACAGKSSLKVRSENGSAEYHDTISDSLSDNIVEDSVDSLGNDNSATPTAIDENNDEKYTDENVNDGEETIINIVMVGDVLLHDGVNRSALKEDGSYDYSAIFANTKDRISQADLAIVNQEVMIGGSQLGVTGYPSFNAPYELADALYDAGFDVIAHATNHAMDRGSKGIMNCLENWTAKYPDVKVVGIDSTPQEKDPILLYDFNGVTIAILNYTYGTNGIPIPEDMPYLVNLLDENRVREDIIQAEELADFTIVCPHWGTEYNLKYTDFQKKWLEIFNECGADLVLGTHPHVIEPIEMYEGSSGNATLCYYSLGNFVNWTSGTGPGVSNRMVGGMADVTLKLTLDGRLVIDDYGISPLVCHDESGFGAVTTYFLKDYSEELANRNEIIKQAKDFSYEYCVKLCEDVWGREMIE